METPQIPTSKFDWDAPTSLDQLLNDVLKIQQFPDLLAKVLRNIQDEHLAYKYRKGGWNIAQIVHHLADAHLNAFIRTKHILAQDTDSIQPYDENKWAEMVDYTFPLESSVIMILGVHQRWSLLLLDALKNPVTELVKTLPHPESKRNVSLSDLIRLYAWHGEHHLSQILQAMNNPVVE